MLASAVLETTTGATTGDLTITGVTNRPRFSANFAANASEASADCFYYSILTQAAIPVLVEEGIGWLSDNNTLKRATIHNTFSGGVVTPGGTAFALTAGTTYNVICASQAASYVVGVHGVATLAGGFAIKAIGPSHMANTVGAVQAKDDCVYVPIKIDSPVMAKGLRVMLGGTTGVGPVARGFRIAFYASLKDGKPGRQLSTSGDLSAATNFTQRFFNFNGATGVRLLPGWYYAALAHDFATTAPSWYSSVTAASVGSCNTPLGKSGYTGLDTVYGCKEALGASWAALPSNASSTLTAIPSSLIGVFVPYIDLV